MIIIAECVMTVEGHPHPRSMTFVLFERAFATSY